VKRIFEESGVSDVVVNSRILKRLQKEDFSTANGL